MNFSDLFSINLKQLSTSFIPKKIDMSDYQIYIGHDDNDIYNGNFVLLKSDILDFNLDKFYEEVTKYLPKVKIYLLANQINYSLVKKILNSKIFKTQLYISETYVYLNELDKLELEQTKQIVSPLNFDDVNKYIETGDLIFGDDSYHKTLTQWYIDQKDPENLVKLYCIKDLNKIVSIGAIIYSPNLNIAYLCDTATLTEYRSLGYQNQLINYRLLELKNLGIKQAYSSVEFGSTSFKNMIRNGFNFCGHGYKLDIDI